MEIFKNILVSLVAFILLIPSFSFLNTDYAWFWSLLISIGIYFLLHNSKKIYIYVQRIIIFFKSLINTWLVTFILSGLVIYLLFFYFNLELFNGVDGVAKVSIEAITKSYSSQFSIISSLVVTILLFVFFNKQIDKDSLLRLTDELEEEASNIDKVIAICVSSGNVWLKQREMLLYLVSNIKMNHQKIHRHIIGSEFLIKEYTSAQPDKPLNLYIDPASAVVKFHRNNMKLVCHNNCNCNAEWTTLPKDNRVFVFVKMKDDTIKAWVYKRNSILLGLYQFVRITNREELTKIQSVAENIDACSTGKIIAPN